MQSGRGFYLANPLQVQHTYTFNYTPRSTGSMNITLTLGKFYLLSYGWDVVGTTDITIALEDLPPPHPHYAGPHLAWPGACCGDSVQFWRLGLGWVIKDRSDDCPTERRWLQSVNDFSPPIDDLWQEPFWFYNECETRIWTHYSTVPDSR